MASKNAPNAKPNGGFALYDVKLRLSGSMLNEVRKEGITAPEAMIYQSIHGPDSMAEMKPSGEQWSERRTDRDERARLVAMFETSQSKRGFVSRMFGPATMQLPREMPDDFDVDMAVPIGADVPEDLASAVLQN